MSVDHSDSQSPDATSDVTELLARQGQLREWIDRLDSENPDDVPPHVAERVRSDYEARLRQVVESLGAHRASIEADARQLEASLRAASGEHERAADELAEGRLRHRLGEWPDADWGTRRAQLEQAVSGAAQEEQKLTAELERIETLLAELDADVLLNQREAVPPPLPEIPEPPGRRLEIVPADQPEKPDEDELVLEGEGAVIAPREPADDYGADPTTRPTAGVKCPECGYTNDATAWYCGVCGVDLT